MDRNVQEAVHANDKRGVHRIYFLSRSKHNVWLAVESDEVLGREVRNDTES